MPYGYLITTALMAVLPCLFAVAPPRPRRPRARCASSFWLGFMVNELPFLAFYVLAASTALAFGQGDIARPGRLDRALGVAVLATAGLVVVVLRSMRTGRGGRRRAEIAAGLPASHIAPAAAQDLPLAVRGAAPGNPSESPTSPTETPGAGLGSTCIGRGRTRAPGRHSSTCTAGRSASATRSREARPLFHRLARRGWVCISANYRLRAQFPDPLVDVKKVLAWVREHGPRVRC